MTVIWGVGHNDIGTKSEYLETTGSAAVRPDASVERTSPGVHRAPSDAAHVKR